MKSAETCRDIGDIAEDSVERKEAVERAEAGEVVKAEVLLIMIPHKGAIHPWANPLRGIAQQHFRMVHNESLMMVIHGDASVVSEENLITLVGRLVHQQDDRLQGISLLGRHFGGRLRFDCTWRGKRA